MKNLPANTPPESVREHRREHWAMVERVNSLRRHRKGPVYARYAFIWFDGKNSNFSPLQLKLRKAAQSADRWDTHSARDRFREARLNKHSLVAQVIADENGFVLI